jgi:hypothetical protein
VGQYSKLDNEASNIMFDYIKGWFMSKKPKAHEEFEGLKTLEEILELEEDVKSFVTYYVKSDGQIYIDMHLADYEEQTLDDFAKIISGLSSLRFQMQTIEMIKDSLIEADELDIFNKILDKMVLATQSDQEQLEKATKDLNQDTDNREDQVWIKPSEVMK